MSQVKQARQRARISFQHTKGIWSLAEYGSGYQYGGKYWKIFRDEFARLKKEQEFKFLRKVA